MILVDTDHLSVLTDPRHKLQAGLVHKLKAAAEPVGIPIVVVEEQLRGWLAQIRRVQSPRKQIGPYLRLAKLLDFLGDWIIVDWDESASDLFEDLRSQRIRIGTQDLKITSIALANDATLLSGNLRDFSKVPGLRAEDWLYK
jgi:tRNA(fMet)-specific endonuclease VapC